MKLNYMKLLKPDDALVLTKYVTREREREHTLATTLYKINYCQHSHGPVTSLHITSKYMQRRPGHNNNAIWSTLKELG